MKTRLQGKMYDAVRLGYLIRTNKDKPLVLAWLKHCRALRQPCLQVRTGRKWGVVFLDMKPAKQKLDLNNRRLLASIGELSGSTDVLCGEALFWCGKIPSEAIWKLAEVLTELFGLANVKEPDEHVA